MFFEVICLSANVSHNCGKIKNLEPITYGLKIETDVHNFIVICYLHSFDSFLVDSVQSASEVDKYNHFYSLGVSNTKYKN